MQDNTSSSSRKISNPEKPLAQMAEISSTHALVDCANLASGLGGNEKLRSSQVSRRRSWREVMGLPARAERNRPTPESDYTNPEAEAIGNEWKGIFPGSTVAIVPFDPNRPRGKTWDQYIAGERNRIFAEAAESRRRARNEVDDRHPP